MTRSDVNSDLYKNKSSGERNARENSIHINLSPVSDLNKDTRKTLNETFGNVSKIFY